MSYTSKPDAGSLARVGRFGAAMIERTDRRRPLFNPFNLAHWMGQASPDHGPKMLLGERIFLKQACVLCGQCVALCPSKAITLEAGEIRFDEKLCLGCCGCLNICPQNAWRSARFGPEYFNKGLHVAAMAEVKMLSGSQVYATEADAPILEDGGKSDPHFGKSSWFAPVKVDRRLRDREFFWMHDWTDDYQEAPIATAIRTPRDLRQIAYDAGVQIGRAHPKQADVSQSKERRREVLHSFESIEARLRMAMRELAGRTDAAWREFRQGAAAQ